MLDALDYLWPYTNEFFADTADDASVAGSGFGVAWSTLQPAWEGAVLPVLGQASLKPPARTPFLSHGKSGRHTEHMGHLLSEMQYLQRTYPGNVW
jgi:ring-1,2-phenylacetyl-CoA epoxidase subunit PaaC